MAVDFQVQSCGCGCGLSLSSFRIGLLPPSVLTVTAQPAILSELLCILGAEGCVVYVSWIGMHMRCYDGSPDFRPLSDLHLCVALPAGVRESLSVVWHFLSTFACWVGQLGSVLARCVYYHNVHGCRGVVECIMAAFRCHRWFNQVIQEDHRIFSLSSLLCAVFFTTF